MVISLENWLRQDARDVPRNQHGWLRCGIFLAMCLLSFSATAHGAVINIAPHRAAYNLKLIQAESGGGIAGVVGGMTFEWADTCEGWVTDQRYLLRFTNDEGVETVVQSSNVNWESKDGLRFRFSTKRRHNGKVTGEFSGEARLERAGGAGTATFTRPHAAKMALPAGTRFPTDLTIRLMQAASRGERSVRALVFEGADMEGAQPVFTTILPMRAARGTGILQPPLGPNPIWPMILAYFRPGRGDSVPETEIAMELQANGVVPSFILDYGTFRLRAELARVRMLPAAAC
jgi:hypothetical protein